MGMHYYGVRSSIVTPYEDLGYTYFSSSLNMEFINDQKINAKNYKYKVIKLFLDRTTANVFEERLHDKFDVKNHEKFYNRVNASSPLFCGGNKEAHQKQSKTINSKEWKNTKGVEKSKKLSNSLKKTFGNISWKSTKGIEKIKNQIRTFNNKQWIEEVGVKRGKRISNALQKTLNNSDWIEKVGLNKYRKQSVSYKNTINSEEWKSTKGVEKSLKISISLKDQWKTRDEETKKQTSKKISNSLKETFRKMGGKPPANCKRFCIFDSDRNVVEEIYGNFVGVCKNKGYPMVAFKRSISSGGKIKFIKETTTKSYFNKYIKYEGWYAREICKETSNG